MYEIRNAGAKGFGIFATRWIPRGTRIMAERPLFVVKSESDVFAATNALSEEDRSRMMQLSVSPIRRSSVLGWTQAAWHATRQVLAEALNVAQGDAKALARLPDFQSIANYPEVLNVFRNNNFDLGHGDQAIFRDICRLNHDCVPNAQGNFNTGIGRFTIHAVRAIDADEEITLSYLAEHGSLKESRQSRLLSSYGFLCECPACDTTNSRSRRGEQRRLELQAKLHAYAEQAVQRDHPDLEAELEMTKALITLFEEEGIAGRELATMYLTAAELAAKIGKKSEVLEFSERGLRFERDCLGQDSPEFGASVARARAVNASLA